MTLTKTKVKKKKAGIDSHIVPQTYLKHFTNVNNLFYQFKIKPVPIAKGKPVTPKSVSYIENYFRINNSATLKSLNTTDVDFIEKEIFKKEENSYNSILAKIQKSNKAIFTREAGLFISFLLGIKSRNSRMRSVFTSDWVKKSFEKHLEEIRPVWSQFKKYANVDFDTFKKDAIDNHINKPEFIEDFYLTTLIAEKSKSEVMGYIKECLLNSAWFIVSTDINNYFITSDNPGYCVDEQEKLINTKFSGEFIFVFPLTSRICFLATNRLKDNYNALSKFLHYKIGSSELVSMLNLGTYLNCNYEIYSPKEKIPPIKKFSSTSVLNSLSVI